MPAIIFMIRYRLFRPMGIRNCQGSDNCKEMPPLKAGMMHLQSLRNVA
jgi:hypothetical protein